MCSNHRDQNLGRWIDNYYIERLLARGGMGRIYLAARRGDRGGRVALKLINPDVFNLANLYRFFEERQILHLLRHPNIVRFLDEGTTDDALPYFVMEYVEGEPIDRYCEPQRLSRRQRLKLVQTVCEVVDFVHRHRIVHRDIKPDNILVSAADGVKLVDFGIAKRLGAETSVQDLDACSSTPRTPEYASPEQLAGEPGTLASDIYSLGALLQHLVIGGSPDDPWSVHTFVAKAMRRNPRHRYGSAAELAADIGCCLAL